MPGHDYSLFFGMILLRAPAKLEKMDSQGVVVHKCVSMGVLVPKVD